MAKNMRKIVRIDEEKCDGCGLCVTSCAEGAIAIIDGKARLVSETYCDGLGACLGECPRDAISIEERPAAEFDEKAVHEHLARMNDVKVQPPAASGGCPSSALKTFQPAAQVPAATGHGGCPGSALKSFQPMKQADAGNDSAEMPPSCLGQWPVQLMLVPPHAPFLKNADILVCADCVPFAVPDFHQRYLNGRVVLVGCPKLDDLAYYREKLSQIIEQAQPASLTVLRMEVPCCAGLASALMDARDSAAPQMPVEVHTIGIREGITRSVK